ncbi:MAG: energy-coupling factor transporter transmembrane protein EcfT [Candidatus Odinarchaeota archaeon]|nr:energy-coupling factor transporter transmembrane protein EcfT [Candidatus Odinarchaeota archaeon]
MPVWLEYQYADTPIHKLNPLTKVLMFGLAMTLAGFYWDLRCLSLIFIIAAILVIIARVPKSWFAPLGVFVVGSLPLTIALSVVQTNPELFKVLPRELAAYYVLRFEIPLIGSFGLTYGGLCWGLATIFRLAILMLLTYTFIYTTSVSELIDLFTRLKVPGAAIYVVMTAYKFVPYMWRTVNNIFNAQKLRGWEIGSRNPVKLFKSLGPIVYPLVSSVVATIDEVSISAQIRGFMAGKMTPIHEFKFSIADIVLSVLSVLLFSIGIYYLIFYNVGLI